MDAGTLTSVVAPKGGVAKKPVETKKVIGSTAPKIPLGKADSSADVTKQNGVSAATPKGGK